MGRHKIAPEWVERTIADPEFTRGDRTHPRRQNAFRRIPELDNRYICVVYEYFEREILVVTVFPDRDAEKKR
jgi:hypothetical protein